MGNEVDIWLGPRRQSRSVKPAPSGRKSPPRREVKERKLSEKSLQSRRWQAYRLEGYSLQTYRFPEHSYLTIELVDGSQIIKKISGRLYWGVMKMRRNTLSIHPKAYQSYVTIRSKANTQ